MEGFPLNDLFVAMAQIARAVSADVKRPKAQRSKSAPKPVRIGPRIIAMLKRRSRSLRQIVADLGLPKAEYQAIRTTLLDLVMRGKVRKVQRWDGTYTNHGNKRYVTTYEVVRRTCDNGSD